MKGHKRPNREKEAELMLYAADVAISKSIENDSKKWVVEFDNGENKPDQVLKLARAAAVLECLVKLMDAGICYRKVIAYKAFNQVLNKHQIHYLPKNVRRLEEKVSKGLSGLKIQDLVKLPRKGNRNAQKLEISTIDTKIRRCRKKGRAKLDDSNYLTGRPKNQNQRNN
ncbi:MAG: hypothetical protein WCR52_12815 [Bacteroidota bacterium]